jgi:hypothetical protein
LDVIERNLPNTALISPKLLTRAFTVWGHYFLAQVIIGIAGAVIVLFLLWSINPNTFLPTQNNIAPTQYQVKGVCPAGCRTHYVNCNIKAVISYGNVKRYYLPSDVVYDSIIVHTDGDDRWFCTEEEATDNGWTHWGSSP